MFFKVSNFLKNLFAKFPQKISKEDLQKLPIRAYSGKIYLINTPELSLSACQEIQKEILLGFDTESKPAFSKGEKYLPSIVQIATSSAVYIFQIAKTGGIKNLKIIFENKNILKVGIAIRDDILKLKEIEIFQDSGFQDIRKLTKNLGVEHTGLRNLAGIFLKCRISKTSQVTDWSQEQLSAKQLTYAATDAWISREVYLEVKKYTP